MLRDCYRDRRTGETQGEKSDSWNSDGIVHTLGSAATPLFYTEKALLGAQLSWVPHLLISFAQFAADSSAQ